MTNENTTPQAPAATLSEAELFGEFQKTSVRLFDTQGEETLHATIASLLEPCCDYCEIDFRIDDACWDNDPTTHLEFVENELLGALADLQLARKAWNEFKRKHLSDNDSTDVDPSYEMPATPEQDMGDEGVEFLEGGPFPDTPVEIDELTSEDVAYIRGEAAE